MEDKDIWINGVETADKETNTDFEEPIKTNATCETQTAPIIDDKGIREELRLLKTENQRLLNELMVTKWKLTINNRKKIHNEVKKHKYVPIKIYKKVKPYHEKSFIDEIGDFFEYIFNVI